MTHEQFARQRQLLKEMTLGTLKFSALEAGNLEHSNVEHHGVSRDVQKLMQDYRSSQDIIVTLGLDKPSEEDNMKVAEVITNNTSKLVPAVETTAIARKPCLYRKDGCDWQAPSTTRSPSRLMRPRPSTTTPASAPVSTGTHAATSRTLSWRSPQSMR